MKRTVTNLEFIVPLDLIKPENIVPITPPPPSWLHDWGGSVCGQVAHHQITFNTVTTADKILLKLVRYDYNDLWESYSYYSLRMPLQIQMTSLKNKRHLFTQYVVLAYF